MPKELDDDDDGFLGWIIPWPTGEPYESPLEEEEDENP